MTSNFYPILLEDNFYQHVLAYYNLGEKKKMTHNLQEVSDKPGIKDVFSLFSFVNNFINRFEGGKTFITNFRKIRDHRVL